MSRASGATARFLVVAREFCLIALAAPRLRGLGADTCQARAQNAQGVRTQDQPSVGSCDARRCVSEATTRVDIHDDA